MATYAVNAAGVQHCRRLIESRQYVLDSDWGDAQPNAAAQNAYLESHSWADYSAWHLGLTEGAGEESKARYAFGYGDFRRVHRTGLIACVYRASEWPTRRSSSPRTTCSSCSTGRPADRYRWDSRVDGSGRSQSTGP